MLRAWLRLPAAVAAAAIWAATARADVGAACRDQAAAAERAFGIPRGLLLAIGQRESGRIDAQTGAVLPWPWSINREGEDHVFASEAEAEDYVAGALRGGGGSIDVGCFQINLKYHPDAFATLRQAFDPAANAAYAARFLRDLHDRDGSWEAAVADYHSATPGHGEAYRDAVLATWRGLPVAASAPETEQPTSAMRLVLGIRIWEPVALQAGLLQPVAARTTLAVGRRGLPRVVTPAAPAP